MNVEEVIRPALDAYMEALDAHAAERVVETFDVDAGVYRYVARCRCGWTSRSFSAGRSAGSDWSRRVRGKARRSVSLHVTAASKRASKVCDVESSRLLAEAQTAERAIR